MALCGPCATASVTPVLAAATTRLGAVVSGLGTGYTALGETTTPKALRRGTRSCGVLAFASGRESEGARRGSGARREGREKVRVAAARAAVRGGGEGDAPDLGDGGDGGAVRGAGLEDVRLLSQPLGSARRRVDIPRWRISLRTRKSARRPHGRGRDRSPPDGRRGRGRDRGAREVRDLPQLLVRGRACSLSRRRRCGMAARTWWLSATPPHRGGSRREALIHRHTKRFRDARGARLTFAATASPRRTTSGSTCALPPPPPPPRRGAGTATRHTSTPGRTTSAARYISARRRRGRLQRELRRLIARVDTAWCVTKDDLRSVHALASSGGAPGVPRESRSRLFQDARVRAPLRGRARRARRCLPCLRCPKAEAAAEGEIPSSLRVFARSASDASHRAPFPSGTEPCYVCLDELKAEPCIRLGCGHVLHSRCALERIRNGWPTQNITFEHLRCPLCGEDGREPTARGSMQAAVMSHPSLARALAPALALRETVMRRARRRLALDANGRRGRSRRAATTRAGRASSRSRA